MSEVNEVYVVIRERSKPGICFPPENWEFDSVIAVCSERSRAEHEAARHSPPSNKPWDGSSFKVISILGPIEVDTLVTVPFVLEEEQTEAKPEVKASS